MAAEDTPVAEEGEESSSSAESRLLESALSLFSEKGYEATSIREIIEAAGVTRPVLYYYFENKEALYSKLVETSFGEIAREFEQIAQRAETCRARLAAFIGSAFQFVEHRPETIRLILQVFFAPPRQGPKLDKNRLWAMRFAPMVQVMA